MTRNVTTVTTRVLAGFADPRFGPDDWARLLRTGDTDSICLTWHCQRAWWESFGRGKLLLVTASRNNQVVALAPLFADGGMIFFICPEDYLDFVGDIGDPETLDALLNTARGQVPDFAGFRFYFVSDKSRTGARLQKAAVRLGLACFDEGALPAPALDLAGQPDAARTATRKKSLMRHERGLQREGELAVRQFLLAAEVLPQLPEFFEQHIARRAALGQASIFLKPEQRAFYERLTRAASEQGWLRFMRVEWKGCAIAFHYGLCYRSRYLYAIPSFAIDLAKRSPGEVLLRQLLLAAIAEGASVFDFGIGDEAYKYRFATQVQYLRTWGLYPSGPVATNQLKHP